jgi:hypothetical protein
MNKDDLQGWLIGVSLLAVFLGFGWYQSAHSDNSATTSSYLNEANDESGNSIEYYKTRLNEYDAALDDANDNISKLNSCSDNVFGSLDDGSYEDAYSQVQDCQADQVSNPGVDL